MSRRDPTEICENCIYWREEDTPAAEREGECRVAPPSQDWGDPPWRLVFWNGWCGHIVEFNKPGTMPEYGPEKQHVSGAGPEKMTQQEIAEHWKK